MVENIPSFSFTLTLPLAPHENPQSPQEIAALPNTCFLYLFMADLQYQLKQMRFAIDHLSRPDILYLRDLLAKVKNLRFLPPQIMQDASHLNFLEIWHHTFLNNQNLALLSMNASGVFYKARGHTIKRINCASLLGNPRSAWMNHLHEFMAHHQEVKTHGSSGE